MQWDDLRVAGAILRNGSYAKAAQQLGLNETTVSRRLSRLEADLGYRIFETVDGERVPTEIGRRVLDVVQGMSTQSEHITNLAGDGRPIARRRLAATETIAQHFLAPTLPTLLDEHPHLNIELQLSTDNASFSRWETDLAVRLSRPDRGNIVIRKLSSYEWLLIQPKESAAVFGCGGIKQYMTDDEWNLQRARLGGLPVVTLNGMAMAKTLLTSGLCMGFLPSYACGDLWDHPALQIESVSSERQVWLLIQEHLRHDPDTRLVTDWIEQSFEATAQGRTQ